jgi:hypothetical protein
LRSREDLVTEANELIEIISTYKVLKFEQILRSIRNKEQSVKKSIIKLLERQDRIYIFDNICSVEEKWTKCFDKGIITAFWVLLDFWDDIIFNSTATYPAKIDFITQEDSFDIIVAERGQEKMLNVFYGKVRDETTKHLVVVEDEEQMTRLTFDGISAFCIVSNDGRVNYYRNEG